MHHLLMLACLALPPLLLSAAQAQEATATSNSSSGSVSANTIATSTTPSPSQTATSPSVGVGYTASEDPTLQNRLSFHVPTMSGNDHDQTIRDGYSANGSLILFSMYYSKAFPEYLNLGISTINKADVTGWTACAISCAANARDAFKSSGQSCSGFTFVQDVSYGCSLIDGINDYSGWAMNASAVSGVMHFAETGTW